MTPLDLITKQDLKQFKTELFEELKNYPAVLPPNKQVKNGSKASKHTRCCKSLQECFKIFVLMAPH